jgi:myo-inositol-1(or 4)-monophosphatase
VILEGLGSLNSLEIDRKQAADFVTRVDRDSEKAIISAISSQYPSHRFLAEESSRDDAGGFRWIIDPLDGTTNFIHGYPAFAVSIALESDGELIAAAVLDPLRDELFTATKGGGVYLNGGRMSVAAFRGLEMCLVSTGFPFRQKHLIGLYLDAFERILLNVSDIRRAGAAALDFAHLACGRCDGFFELGLSPWDIAAGALLVTEAGGVVTDFSGGDGFLSTGNVIAGLPEVHGMLLAETRAVFSGKVDR